jgi:zinc transport system substrate-binding protein
MYPAGTDPYKYKFTKKQLNDYSKSDLIIYNGLDKEKDYIVDMLNKNKELKIIDASARIEYQNNIDEIWINPSNVLTVAQNVRNGLKEYIESTYLQKQIDTNYDKLKMKLSSLDADIKEEINNAPYKQILVTNDNLKILEKYDLKVYSLDEKSLNDKTYNEVVKLIQNGQIRYIYKTEYDKNDTMDKLKIAFPSLEIIEINSLNNITDNDKKNNKDYISIMNENRDKLKKELYK